MRNTRPTPCCAVRHVRDEALRKAADSPAAVQRRFGVLWVTCALNREYRLGVHRAATAARDPERDVSEASHTVGAASCYYDNSVWTAGVHTNYSSFEDNAALTRVDRSC